MMNKKVIGYIFLFFLLFISHLLLITQIIGLKKEVKTLQIKTEELGKSLIEHQEHQDLQIETINNGITSILSKQEENKTEIKNDLAKINQKADAQFSKTVGMSKTYDTILEEQKKKTIDTAEKDKSILVAKKNALALYKKGSYSDAYDEYKKLVQAYTEDMECRLYKAKSLYYKNRADSSSYAEILKDIRILKQNATADDEILEIEKSIVAEKDGLDE